MFVEKWFSTPIFYHQLEYDEFDNVQAQIAPAIEKIKKSDLSNPWGDTVETSFKYNTNSNFIVDHNLSLLEDLVLRCADSYLNQCTESDNLNIGIKQSWINLSNKNQFQFEHQHLAPFSTVVMSGVYYFQTNEHDGDTTFLSPNPYQSAGFSIFGEHKVTYKPQVGKLVLFPSWLRHRVEPNTTDDERISITVNLAHFANLK